MNAQPEMINLTIDGKAVTVLKGTTVFQAAKSMGIEVPIFCYQDRMPPFGACRVCLVEVEKMPKLQTSCTLEATEGMVVKTQSTLALDGRQSILEFLLINHPLDCPICDRGGECPLQENALAHGPGESRFYEEKRHFTKAKPLGPVLMLDRERCIVCARCTRFGDLVAGDHALEFIERGYRTEVGTPGGGPVESKFIGNTIMICPVGALTSQVYRFRARPWDNQPTESTCTLCPVGCSMIFDSRDGKIMRTRARENRDVNDMWLCDKGWFGYEFVDDENRLQQPLVRKNGQLQSATWEEALTTIIQKLQAAKHSGKAAGFGGNPLTIEENFLFQKIIREGANSPHVDHRIGSPAFSLEEEGLAPGMSMPIKNCEELAGALLLGLDLTEEFPVIWLRLKQAINRGAKVSYIGHYKLEIASQLQKSTLHAPGKELEILDQHLAAFAKECPTGQGALFVGRQYLHTPFRRAILAKLVQFSTQHPHIQLQVMEGTGNSLGARWAGMHPALAPFGQKPAVQGKSAGEVLDTAAKEGWEVLYVAGANPALKYPSQLWQAARQQTKCLIVQDIFLTETAQQADVVLPTLSYVEKGGTFLNIEGRTQTLLPGKEVAENQYSDAEIFAKIAEKLGIDISGEIRMPELAKQSEWIGGLSASSPTLPEVVLAASFVPALFDHGVRMQHNPHVVKLAKEPVARLHPLEATKKGLKDGEEVTVSSKKGSIKAKLKLDKQIADHTIILPLGFPEVPVHELETQLFNGLQVEVRKN